MNQTESKINRIQEDLLTLIASVGGDRSALRLALMAADRCLDAAFSLACEDEGYEDAVALLSDDYEKAVSD